MRTRHRNNGNGRSNSMGMGGGLAAGRHNGEYRNFNRGYGRGPPKHFPPPQTPRKSDIFMEAGRLAAEYLVSQGFLPPEVLPGKWQNGSLKTQIEDFQEFKSQDREQLQMPSEGRMPAHARLGNAVHDAGFLKRRFPDDLNPTGSRGKKWSESFKGYSSDWGKENGSSGSWSEKSKPFSDMEVEDGFVSVNNEEDQQVGLDVSGGVPEVISNEIPLSDKISEFNSNEISSIGDNAGASLISDTAVTNDASLKKGSSSCKKELQPQAEGEISKDSDDSNVLNMDEEVKPGMTGGKIDKDEAAEKVSMQYPAVEGDAMNKNASDLLRLCTFAKVPTRARSLLPYKGSKVDLVPITTEEDTCVAVAAPLEEPKVTTEKNSVEGFSDGTLTNQTQSSKCFDSDIIGAAAVQSLEDARDSEPASEDRGKCTRTQSFPGTSLFMDQEDLGQDSSGFGRCSSLIERGEKRSLQNDDYREWSKKPREWSSSMVVDADEHYHLQNFEAKPSSSHQGRHSPDIEVVKAVDLEILADDSLLSKGGAESGVELKEERRFFPSSFKICDLNLMESSDMTEHHDTDPVLDSPSTLEAKKGVAVDVDSSMSNNCKTSNDFRGLVHGKEVIIVDLDNDSENEDKGFHTPDRKTEALYSGGLESFPNNMENTDHLPDAQDGYGLMISELLGTDIPNCSSVPADITSLPTEMSLHNEAGILCDDDPIFLSLGEIPISFPGVWPEKPF